MKIKHSLYELVSKRAIQSKNTYSARQGALIRVEFDDGLVGYADCHPWKELGDQPLKAQLELLNQGKCTRLTARSIHFAKLDAKARSEKINLLKNLKPTSHYTIFNLDDQAIEDANSAAKQGFTHFKIKLGSNLLHEEERLKEIVKNQPAAKIRLDFNAKLNRDQFVNFLDQTAAVRPNIDFVEDPFPYDYTQWRQIQDAYRIDLAADEYYKEAFGNPEAAKVLIMKPAVHAMKQMDSSQKLVITSYLDHPIGQMAAAYMAAKVTQGPAGLLSHFAYEFNPFSNMIKHQGAALLPVDGYGFGFDELLKNQDWKS